MEKNIFQEFVNDKGFTQETADTLSAMSKEEQQSFYKELQDARKKSQSSTKEPNSVRQVQADEMPFVTGNSLPENPPMERVDELGATPGDAYAEFVGVDNELAKFHFNSEMDKFNQTVETYQNPFAAFGMSFLIANPEGIRRSMEGIKSYTDQDATAKVVYQPGMLEDISAILEKESISEDKSEYLKILEKVNNTQSGPIDSLETWGAILGTSIGTMFWNEITSKATGALTASLIKKPGAAKPVELGAKVAAYITQEAGYIRERCLEMGISPEFANEAARWSGFSIGVSNAIQAQFMVKGGTQAFRTVYGSVAKKLAAFGVPVAVNAMAGGVEIFSENYWINEAIKQQNAVSQVQLPEIDLKTGMARGALIGGVVSGAMYSPRLMAPVEGSAKNPVLRGDGSVARDLRPLSFEDTQVKQFLDSTPVKDIINGTYQMFAKKSTEPVENPVQEAMLRRAWFMDSNRMSIQKGEEVQNTSAAQKKFKKSLSGQEKRERRALLRDTSTMADAASIPTDVLATMARDASEGRTTNFNLLTVPELQVVSKQVESVGSFNTLWKNLRGAGLTTAEAGDLASRVGGNLTTSSLMSRILNNTLLSKDPYIREQQFDRMRKQVDTINKKTTQKPYEGFGAPTVRMLSKAGPYLPFFGNNMKSMRYFFSDLSVKTGQPFFSIYEDIRSQSTRANLDIDAYVDKTLADRKLGVLNTQLSLRESNEVAAWLFGNAEQRKNLLGVLSEKQREVAFATDEMLSKKGGTLVRSIQFKNWSMNKFAADEALYNLQTTAAQYGYDYNVESGRFVKETAVPIVKEFTNKDGTKSKQWTGATETQTTVISKEAVSPSLLQLKANYRAAIKKRDGSVPYQGDGNGGRKKVTQETLDAGLHAMASGNYTNWVSQQVFGSREFYYQSKQDWEKIYAEQFDPGRVPSLQYDKSGKAIKPISTNSAKPRREVGSAMEDKNPIYAARAHLLRLAQAEYTMDAQAKLDKATRESLSRSLIDPDTNDSIKTWRNNAIGIYQETGNIVPKALTHLAKGFWQSYGWNLPGNARFVLRNLPQSSFAFDMADSSWYLHSIEKGWKGLHGDTSVNPWIKDDFEKDYQAEIAQKNNLMAFLKNSEAGNTPGWNAILEGLANYPSKSMAWSDEIGRKAVSVPFHQLAYDTITAYRNNEISSRELYKRMGFFGLSDGTRREFENLLGMNDPRADRKLAMDYATQKTMDVHGAYALKERTMTEQYAGNRPYVGLMTYPRLHMEIIFKQGFGNMIEGTKRGDSTQFNYGLGVLTKHMLINSMIGYGTAQIFGNPQGGLGQAVGYSGGSPQLSVATDAWEGLSTEFGGLYSDALNENLLEQDRDVRFQKHFAAIENFVFRLGSGMPNMAGPGLAIANGLIDASSTVWETMEDKEQKKAKDVIQKINEEVFYRLGKTTASEWGMDYKEANRTSTEAFMNLIGMSNKGEATFNAREENDFTWLRDMAGVKTDKK